MRSIVRTRGKGAAASALTWRRRRRQVRYNIFQALQYITDWLGGNGCVALPASLTNKSGKKVFVRIMDDLATTERSRWELWAEVRAHHGHGQKKRL